MKIIRPLLLLLLTVEPLHAAITETFTYNGLNLAVPDGNPSGLADTHTIASDIDTITDVHVTLHIGATATPGNTAYNGDLYAYLQHSSGLSILLNRVGRTALDPFGYGDNGFNVTLSDDASNGDIHTYQTVTTPTTGAPLIGFWQPDARAVDPDLVTTTSSRTAFLSTFDGLDPDGVWTLFVADLVTGSAHTVTGYSLEITGTAAVPEPGDALFAVACGIVILLRRRRR